jgi:hypothetical protein
MKEDRHDIIIFCGPSGYNDLKKLYPSFIYREPAQQGDIFQAAHSNNTKAIVLIDGYYKSVPAVWHKEIIYAIDQGITVIGAASLGALRAVELEAYGMLGVGEIYELYKKGILFRDPDVAVAHTGRDDCFRALTVPIVNILATINKNLPNLSGGVINEVLQISRSIYFEYRTMKTLLKALSTSSLPDNQLKDIQDILVNCYVDQKAIDASNALSWTEKNLTVKPSAIEANLNHTLYWHALKDNDSYINSDLTGLYSTKQGFLAFQLLEKPEDFMHMRERSITLALCLWLGSLYNIEATEQEIEEARGQLKSDLDIQNSEYITWLGKRGLSSFDCDSYLRACIIEKKIKDKAQLVNPLCSFNQLHYVQAAIGEDSEYLLGSYQKMVSTESNQSMASMVKSTENMPEHIPVKTHEIVEKYRRIYALKQSGTVYSDVIRFPMSYVRTYARIHHSFKQSVSRALTKLLPPKNKDNVSQD